MARRKRITRRRTYGFVWKAKSKNKFSKTSQGRMAFLKNVFKENKEMITSKIKEADINSINREINRGVSEDKAYFDFFVEQVTSYEKRKLVETVYYKKGALKGTPKEFIYGEAERDVFEAVDVLARTSLFASKEERGLYNIRSNVKRPESSDFRKELRKVLKLKKNQSINWDEFEYDEQYQVWEHRNKDGRVDFALAYNYDYKKKNNLAKIIYDTKEYQYGQYAYTRKNK